MAKKVGGNKEGARAFLFGKRAVPAFRVNLVTEIKGVYDYVSKLENLENDKFRK